MKSLAYYPQLTISSLLFAALLSSAYYLQLTISSLLSLPYCLQLYCLQLTLFSLLSSAYSLQLYCLQLYCLQLTVFSLLSSALLSLAYCLQLYCLQLTVPKMQLSDMGWSCRLCNKVVFHKWSWQPCYVRRLLFRHGLITKLPLSAAPYSIVSSALADGLWS